MNDVSVCYENKVNLFFRPQILFVYLLHFKSDDLHNLFQTFGSNPFDFWWDVSKEGYSVKTEIFSYLNENDKSKIENFILKIDFISK